MTVQDQHELEIARIMREATRAVDVPAGRLAAGGLRRGRVARLRRRAAAGLAVVAAAATIVGTYQVVPHGTSARTSGTPTSGAVATGPAGSQRTLADPEVVLRRVLDALPAGKVTGASAEPLAEGATGFRISLHLDGALVSFSVDDPNARRTAHGLSALGPDTECRNSQPMPPGCRELADGSWENNFSGPTGGVGVPSNRVDNDAWYWSADGWRVYSAAFNATAEKTGTMTGPVPPVTVAQLKAIAQSDVWFARAAD